jgi:hypothetical protein
MYIKKLGEIPFIFDLPKDLKQIAFGQLPDQGCEFFFAFFVDEKTDIQPGTKIEGAKYAEGTMEDFRIMEEVEVTAYRKHTGNYLIKPHIPHSSHGHRFILYLDGRQSTCNGKPIQPFSIRLLH